jgi:glycosyltransferase involved in cell wall biosynthesis
MKDRLPTFSVVIEWENVKLSDVDRARRMLRALEAQLRSLRPRFSDAPEIWFLHDRYAIDAKALMEMVAEAFSDPTLAAIHFEPTRDADYYEQKNVGAALAKGEVVVFLDSDVIPEEGWLEGLLDALADPAVEVVGGNTAIELDSYVSRAFALFWFFPLRADRSGLRESNHFFANNVAFRSDLIRNKPFPRLPVLRGSCTILAQQLLSEGHSIRMNESSRVSHPPPNGYAHVFRRAMAQGHDDLLLGNLRLPHHYQTRVANALWRFQKRVKRAFKRIRKEYHEVGLSWLGALGAGLIAINYFAFYLVGLVVSLVSPDFVPRRFPV